MLMDQPLAPLHIVTLQLCQMIHGMFGPQASSVSAATIQTWLDIATAVCARASPPSARIPVEIIASKAAIVIELRSLLTALLSTRSSDWKAALLCVQDCAHYAVLTAAQSDVERQFPTWDDAIKSVFFALLYVVVAAGSRGVKAGVVPPDTMSVVTSAQALSTLPCLRSYLPVDAVRAINERL